MAVKALRWPYPYKWAFGLIDDTDCSTLEAVLTVYEHCLDAGITPTKTVWAQAAERDCGHPVSSRPIVGTTLDDDAYREYCEALAKRGVEFCLHDVSPGNNLREDTLRGFETFERTFGYAPRVHVFHSHNCDHIYWGENQYGSRFAKALVRLMTGKRDYFGEDHESPYYWSDVCRDKISYIRLYRTRDFNVLKHNPNMPYHLHGKPDVKLWFSASASRPDLDRVTDSALDRIARDDGAFLLYAYSSNLADVTDRSRMEPVAGDAFSRIGGRSDCWRTSISEILDRCLATKNVLITVRRHACVISNPTALSLDGFQFRSDRDALYRADGQRITPDEEGRFHLDSLRAGECLALYFSNEAAESGDPGGISGLEKGRMMFEEFKHLVYKRVFQMRRRLKWRWRNRRR